MKRIAFAVFSVIVCLLGAACVGPAQAPEKTRFYTLEYPPPQASAAATLEETIRVERFQAAPVYATNRIVYREKAFERQTYTYHRWRASPADLVTFFLARDLRHSGLFRAIYSYDSRFAATYAVEGSVDEFLEADTRDRWTAVLTLSIVLLKENEPDVSKRVVFQRVYSQKEPCALKNPAALAEAMSIAMSRVSAEITRDIHAALTNDGIG